MPTSWSIGPDWRSEEALARYARLMTEKETNEIHHTVNGVIVSRQKYATFALHLKIEKFCSKLFNSIARRSSRVDRQHFACRSLCRSRAIQDRSCRSNRHCDQRFWPANVQREYQRAGRFGRRQSLLCRAENSCTSARQSRGTVSGIEARF